MIRIGIEHAAGFFVVVLLSVLLVLATKHGRETGDDPLMTGGPTESDSLDVSDPLQFTLFIETINVFYSQSPEIADTYIRAKRDRARISKVLSERQAAAGVRGLSPAILSRLGGMYLSFIAMYAVSLLTTVIAARIGAVVKYLADHTKRSFRHRFLSATADMWDQPGSWRKMWRWLVLFPEGIGWTLLTVILFSPAYVVAYVAKPDAEEGNIVFMVLLAVLTNGVLAGLANTFYLILNHERRKGYVETARVKGLSDIAASGGSWRETVLATVWPMRTGRHDVFHHVYANARLQFIPPIKRHAQFLISGLIIIEMALNLQGHLSYELMQSMMYGDLERVAAISVGIFAAVKLTELSVDIWHERELRTFRNPFHGT
jgi:ABC-type dipeptide/oligopeptide/nickel transport system permease component